MYIRNQALSVIYKCSALLTGAWALAQQTDLLEGAFRPASMCYYTNLSNLLCVLYFLFALLWQICFSNRRQTTFLPRFKGALVMCILLTMLVYHFMLGGYGGSAGNKIVHYYMPAMTILDWVLFDRKGMFRARDPLLWPLIPLSYMIFIFIRAEKGPAVFGGGRFPYPFIDADRYGWATVGKTCAFLLAAYLLAGFLLLLIDRALGAAAKRRRRLRAGTKNLPDKNM